MKRLTSINVTPEFIKAEKYLLEKSGISKAVFHRKALEHFLNGKMEVDQDLAIMERSNPRYIRKPEKENIYITDDIRDKLVQVAKEKNVKYTVLIFQALLDYCMVMEEYFPEINEVFYDK